MCWCSFQRKITKSTNYLQKFIKNANKTTKQQEERGNDGTAAAAEQQNE